MANYSFTFKDDSLEHHGIDGQKWGVRNGPPYPLGSGDHSAAEKRAMANDNKRNYKDIKKKVSTRSSWYSKNMSDDVPDRVKNQILEKKDRISDLMKVANAAWILEDDFMKSKEYLDAAKAEVDQIVGKSYSGRLSKNDWLSLYYYDDLGQNLFEKYRDDHPDKYPNYLELSEKSYNAYEELNNLYKSIAIDSLGKYADKTIKDNSHGRFPPVKAKTILTEAIEQYIKNDVLKDEYEKASNSTFSNSKMFEHIWDNDEQLKALLSSQYKD